MKKVCNICKQEKDIEDFVKREKNRYRPYCKVCGYEKCKKYNADNREQIEKLKKEFYLKNKERILKEKKEEYHKNIDKYRLSNNMNYIKNIEHHKAYNNLPHIKERKNKARRERRLNDPIYRLINILRTRQKFFLKGDRTEVLIGCSFEEAWKYIESLMTPEMTRENQGTFWEVDHVYPLAAFDLNNIESQKVALNYSNLQPLEKSKNKKKSDKIPNNFLEKLYKDFKLYKKFPASISRKKWDSLSPIELRIFKDLIYLHYSKVNFQESSINIEKQKKDLEYIKNIFLNSNKDLLNTKCKLHKILWEWFPNHLEASRKSNSAPIEKLKSSNKFRKLIDNRIKHASNISRNNLILALGGFFEGCRVTNFRPLAAYYIYNKYCRDNSTVWDMSSGWGSRYLGALLCNKVSTYIGTEPASKTHDSLIAFSNTFNREGLTTQINKCGSEEFCPLPNTLDVCFTSPPYFNLETYCDEETQSIKRFPAKEVWIEGFLKKTMEHCSIGLKKDGILAINVANTAAYTTLEEDFLEIMKSLPFEYVETLEYKIKKRTGGHKSEPIFIFKKI